MTMCMYASSEPHRSELALLPGPLATARRGSAPPILMADAYASTEAPSAELILPEAQSRVLKQASLRCNAAAQPSEIRRRGRTCVSSSRAI